jgi:hypothetical protein
MDNPKEADKPDNTGKTGRATDKDSGEFSYEDQVTQNVLRRLQHARLMLDYGSDHCIDVDRKAVNELLELDLEFRKKDALDAAEELKLRFAYRTIAQAMHPITVQSILDTHGNIHDQGRHSWFYARPSTKAVLTFGLFAIFCLIITILSQAYWVTGASIVKDLTANLQQYQEIENQIIKREHGVMNREDGKTATRAEINLSEDQLHVTMKSVFAQLVSDELSLRNWYSVWISLSNTSDHMRSERYLSLDPTTQARTVVAAANLALQAMASYFLPMMYGLLGAAIYVMRSLSDSIRQSSFTVEDISLHIMRLALGPLAGIAIGLIAVPEVPSTVNAGTDAFFLHTLTPLSLAFLAGYGIELLFAVMDRIIQAFVGKPRTPASRLGVD